MLPITIRYPLRPQARSLAVCAVADMFDIDVVGSAIIVADQVDLDLRPCDLALFIGPSGSGKSSLLRAAAGQLSARDVNATVLPELPLIDLLPGTVPNRLALLASCGLSEGRLALRTPAELSDGQRARFRLAYALQDHPRTPVIIDEFAALLDRTTAKVLAHNLRRLVDRTGVAALVATTHEDIVGDLNPDVMVHCRGDGDIAVERRNPEKKVSVCCRSFGSRPAPAPIGRTSLGGITAAISSASSPRSCCCGTAKSPSASAYSPRPCPACGSARATSASAAICAANRCRR